MFTFRLERVLAIRRLEEDAARLRYAEAEERLRAARGALSELRSQSVSALEGLDELKRNDQLTAEFLYLHTLHLAGLRRRIEVARHRVDSASQDVDRAAEELFETHKAKRSLERYREREQAEWRKETALKEAKDIDEIAVSRHRAREEGSHGP